jgi:hypothetical protein
MYHLCLCLYTGSSSYGQWGGGEYHLNARHRANPPYKLSKLFIKAKCSQQATWNATLFLAVSKFLPNLDLYHLLKMKFNKTDANYFE